MKKGNHKGCLYIVNHRWRMICGTKEYLFSYKMLSMNELLKTIDYL
ncbi:hypothetical protein QE390_003752 [Siphonobacter sp. SORGH_AS 1065]|nr:hypothetical protein [Siphonobacter sp. SORGH_AS_1065]